MKASRGCRRTPGTLTYRGVSVCTVLKPVSSINERKQARRDDVQWGKAKAKALSFSKDSPVTLPQLEAHSAGQIQNHFFSAPPAVAQDVVAGMELYSAWDSLSWSKTFFKQNKRCCSCLLQSVLWDSQAPPESGDTSACGLIRVQ